MPSARLMLRAKKYREHDLNRVNLCASEPCQDVAGIVMLIGRRRCRTEVGDKLYSSCKLCWNVNNKYAGRLSHCVEQAVCKPVARVNSCGQKLSFTSTLSS